ncbi:chaperonin 10-like protein [Abortiporus biennis]|nr:chaperonin 10-like protein [Abortiporus biennis]
MSSIPTTHEAVGLTSKSSGLVSFQLPTEAPDHDEVLIKVEWTLVSPVDLWQVDFDLLQQAAYPVTYGVNIVGEVVRAGEDTPFQTGDKVFSMSFTHPSNKGKGFQEYATVPSYRVAKLPSNISPQEAVTIPDNFVTAYFTLFGEPNLQLPIPSELPSLSTPLEAETPILVWGAGGSVGQYALQILKLAGYRNVIAVASTRHHEYLLSLGAKHTVDYRSPSVVEDILRYAGGKLKYVFDTIADEDGSLKLISQVVEKGSKVAFLQPVRVGPQGAVTAVKHETDIKFPEGAKLLGVRTFLYQDIPKFKEELQPKIMPDLVARGLIKPNRVHEVEGKTLLERIKNGLDTLRRGEVSGDRLVIRIIN